MAFLDDFFLSVLFGISELLASLTPSLGYMSQKGKETHCYVVPWVLKSLLVCLSLFSFQSLLIFALHIKLFFLTVHSRKVCLVHPSGTSNLYLVIFNHHIYICQYFPIHVTLFVAFKKSFSVLDTKFSLSSVLKIFICNSSEIVFSILA